MGLEDILSHLVRIVRHWLAYYFYFSIRVLAMFSIPGPYPDTVLLTLATE